MTDNSNPEGVVVLRLAREEDHAPPSLTGDARSTAGWEGKHCTPQQQRAPALGSTLTHCELACAKGPVGREAGPDEAQGADRPMRVPMREAEELAPRAKGA